MCCIYRQSTTERQRGPAFLRYSVWEWGRGSLYNCGRNVPIKVGVSFFQSVLNPGGKSDWGIGMLLRGSYRF